MGKALKNSWNNRSLRLKMTLLYVGLLFILLATLSCYIYLDIRSFLIESTETRLRAQAKPTIEGFLAREPQGNGDASDAASGTGEFLEGAGLGGSAPVNAPDPGTITDISEVAEDLSLNLTSRDTTATILDGSGGYLADGRVLDEEVPAIAPESSQVVRALGGQNEIQYIDQNEAGERMLVLLIPLRSATDEAIIGVAQLNTPLAVTDEILSRERLLILTGMLLALVVGTLGGLAITGAALSPLTAMISTCRRLASGDLSERVNLPLRRDEVGQLANAFDEMADRIEATFAAQRRFSADAAHELRTPLTALGGSLEVIMRGSGDDPQAANQLIRGMHKEVIRLGKLSEQLLDISRLDTPLALNYEDFPLPEFFGDFVQQARYLAPDNPLSLEEGPGITLHADRDGLKQALFNLTDNAAQHTSPGEVITLGWAKRGEEIELWVADEGEGISEEDLPHIFEPFYRGDRSRSRRRGGTGLGLALVRDIAESHGGRLSVESDGVGEGSRFTVILPQK